MKRLFSSTRISAQVLSLLAVFGFLGLGEITAQTWQQNGNGNYVIKENVGIGKVPSSWVDLDVRSTIRLTPRSEESKGWATQLLFAEYSGNSRFNIVDDFTHNSLLFQSAIPNGYFMFRGRTVISAPGNPVHYLPVGMHSDYSLAVVGKIVTEEVVVTTNGWADYVFRPDYDLLPLETVAIHIEENGFLPNMPCAAEVEENGIEVSTMTVMQQEKIEELFLHMIEMNDRLKSLEAENAALKSLLNK